MATVSPIIVSLLMSVVLATGGDAAHGSDDYLAKVSPDDCEHGIFPQPDGGPFSAFIFCDDAAGVNIGIILTEPGAGPGSIELTGVKAWDGWDRNDRFWQDEEWATDVAGFAWSPSLKVAYVATSSVYGDGGLFQLDLVNRTFKRILPDQPSAGDRELQSGYSTRIEHMDLETNTLTIGICSPEEEMTATTQTLTME